MSLKRSTASHRSVRTRAPPFRGQLSPDAAVCSPGEDDAVQHAHRCSEHRRGACRPDHPAWSRRKSSRHMGHARQSIPECTARTEQRDYLVPRCPRVRGPCSRHSNAFHPSQRVSIKARELHMIGLSRSRRFRGAVVTLPSCTQLFAPNSRKSNGAHKSGASNPVSSGATTPFWPARCSSEH